MENKPTLSIVAGPNGAGKSTFSRELIPPGVEIWDMDALYLKAQKDFPYMDSEVWTNIGNQQFEEGLEKSFMARESVAFETNYRTEWIRRDYLERFQGAGFTLRLFCFGLDYLEDSAKRVEKRVLKGGHDVHRESREYNFTMGPVFMKKDLPLYDQVIFLEARQFSLQVVGMLKKEGKERIQILDPPLWYERDYQQKVDELYPYTSLKGAIAYSSVLSTGKGYRI